MDEFTPSIGMSFDSMDDAWIFWKQYGQKIGFAVRKKYLRKSRTIFRIFCCSKEGKRQKDKRRGENPRRRWETRCGCEARMECMLVRESMKIVVRQFMGEHNHGLEFSDSRCLLRSQKEMNVMQGQCIGMADDARFRRTETHKLMVMENEGRDCAEDTDKVQRSHLRAMSELKDYTPSGSTQPLPVGEELHTWSCRMMVKFMRNCLHIGVSSDGRKMMEDKLVEIHEMVECFFNVDFDEGPSQVVGSGLNIP